MMVCGEVVRNEETDCVGCEMVLEERIIKSTEERERERGDG